MSDPEHKQKSYSRNEVELCGTGELFGSDTGKLPTGNMLMIDRIVEISTEGELFSFENTKLVIEKIINNVTVLFNLNYHLRFGITLRTIFIRIHSFRFRTAIFI